MPVLVRTEFGINKYTSITFKGEKSKKFGCKDVEEIIRIGEEI